MCPPLIRRALLTSAPCPPPTGWRGVTPCTENVGGLSLLVFQPVLAAGRNTHWPKRNCIYISSVHPAPGSQKGLNKWVSEDQGGQWGREDILLPSHARDEGAPTHCNHDLPPPRQALGLKATTPQGHRLPHCSLQNPAKAAEHFLSPNFRG